MHPSSCDLIILRAPLGIKEKVLDLEPGRQGSRGGPKLLLVVRHVLPGMAGAEEQRADSAALPGV